METTDLYIGTSGIVLPFKNQANYPVEFDGQSRLQVYGHIFNSIEVNSTFYKLPKPETVARWSGTVPENFRFTFKLWKELTHNSGITFNRSDLSAFANVIKSAGDNRGCILVQLPPSTKFSSLSQLGELLSNLQQETDDEWPVAIEFRDKSWYRQESYDLLDAYNATMVYHDKAGSQSTLEPLRSETIYLRFHGPEGNYRGSYDQGLLHEYAGYVQEWHQARKKVYIYFNNTAGDALANLQTLRTYVTNGNC
ncbi:Uncharacterized conserved protein YecE, DUF72 family [Dyadobacter soli]|uniref:Uncharacterized conserved protein YecE, DUF72 family n=1 Tax=Dyadobacter soli TaxID=659014 RepID=A0A1G7VMW4_9BACT|nr:DUF72 domain-containing protein [Dyadobacter soli]SDG61145.1 Uncharacterized conserved protein YecE, DUF72 family [Dyadobacter soli]